MSIHYRSLYAALLSLPLASFSAHAATSYTLTDLGTLGGEYSRGMSINNLGQVTGVSSTAGTSDLRAFLYSDGVMSNLGTLGGSGSYGWGINDHGQVTGRADTLYYVPHAFSTNGSTMTDLGTMSNRLFGVGTGINNAGHVTGFAYTTYAYTSSIPAHAFVYRDGVMTDLGTLGGSESYGYGINDANEVTGQSSTSTGQTHAFVHKNGSMLDLGTLGGGYSFGRAINNAGQVTGSAETSNGQSHTFLYSNGVMSDLGTLGGGKSRGNDINNLGQITGFAYSKDDSTYRAFVYSDGAMLDLNELLDPLSTAGWFLSEGTGINDLGQITGEGSFNGQQRAFLLTPVPEPATYALTGFGLLMLSFAARRKR